MPRRKRKKERPPSPSTAPDLASEGRPRGAWEDRPPDAGGDIYHVKDGKVTVWKWEDVFAGDSTGDTYTVRRRGE